MTIAPISRNLARRCLAGLGIAALALATAACATAPSASDPAQAAGSKVQAERHVTIATPTGSADALLFLPAGGRPAPAVLLWADIGGLRPAISQIGRKLAGEGYVVLAPNAFYRSVQLDGSTASDVEQAKRMAEWRGAATDDAIASDSKAYVAFLDTLPEVDRQAPVGTAGFDIGSAYAFIAARSVPDRIGAVAIFHPSGTATARANSPHLFVGQSRAAYYVAMAANDDQREPEDKDQFREAFAKAGLAGTVEVLGGNHGFALPDNAAHDDASEQQSWARMVALFRQSLK